MLTKLREGFKKNLELQQSKQKWISTKVKKSGSEKVLVSVDTSRYMTDYFGNNKFFPEAPMSSIALRVQLKGIKNWYTLRNKFKSMKCFPLFSGYEDRDNGLVEYALEFGSDYESAAKICKEVLLTLYSLSPNDLIDCWTDEVNEQIFEKRNIFRIIYMIFYGIGTVSILLFQVICLLRKFGLFEQFDMAIIFLPIGIIMLIIGGICQYVYMHKKD
jgi:hypothetical protein